jgi:hypothetical protein
MPAVVAQPEPVWQACIPGDRVAGQVPPDEGGAVAQAGADIMSGNPATIERQDSAAEAARRMAAAAPGNT